MVLGLCWYFWLIFAQVNCSSKFSFFCCPNIFELSWIDSYYKTWTYYNCYYNCCCSRCIRNSTFCWSTLISLLIKSVSRVLQKLLRCFNGTLIFTCIVSVTTVNKVISDLGLNDSESAKALLGLSLQYCYNLPDDAE